MALLITLTFRRHCSAIMVGRNATVAVLRAEVSGSAASQVMVFSISFGSNVALVEMPLLSCLVSLSL